jgi:apolipoprotein N-acyltransferase
VVLVAIGALAGWLVPGSPLGAVVVVTALVASIVLLGARAGTGWWLGSAVGLGWFGVWFAWLDVIGIDAWIGLTVYCAAWWGLIGVGAAVVLRLPGGPLWVAAVWVLVEALRARVPFGGFPWARLPTGTEPPGWLTGPLIMGGIPVATLLVTAFGAWLGVVVANRMRGRATAPWTSRRALRFAAVITAAIGILVVPPFAFAPPDEEGSRSLSVAVVQGDVPGAGLDFLGRRAQVLNNHVEQTLRLAEAVERGDVAQPDLVVWPENASDIDPLRDERAAQLISGAVDAVGAPTLIGAVLDVPDEPLQVRNAAIVWRPEVGPGDLYVKRKPVPFGEFVPFRDALERWITRFDRVPRDFVAGTTPGVVQVDGVRVGVVICFEVADDRMVRDAIRAGGEALVVMTNNATYAGTDQPDQQFTVTRQRAVEHRRSTLVAATTGITGAIGADGTVLAQLPESEPGYAVVEVPLSSAWTPATRAGEAVEGALAIVGAVAWALGALIARRSRRRPAAEEPAA